MTGSGDRSSATMARVPQLDLGMTLRARVTRMASFRGECVESSLDGVLFGYPIVGGRIVLFVTPVEQFVTSVILEVQEVRSGTLRIITSNSEYAVVLGSPG